MKIDGETEYKTKDLGESSAIVISGQKIIDIRRDGKVCWFIFDDAEKCEEISREYFFGNLQGSLRNYNETMGILKNRIFSNVR